MKILRLLSIPFALALLASCEKPQSEAEKNAQIEKEVQARLAAQQRADEQQRLAQQAAELDAREKALAAKESSTATAETETETEPTPRSAPRLAASSVAEDDSAPRSYDTFYRKLEPYGSWRETDDYGYVFQPRAAQTRNWRPYTDGRWAYTDAGWTWVSDEPFGWATYHYGRWTKLSGVGWVWVPGEEWAPAWVSWRKGDQNVGWAPLPPEARFDRGKGIHKWADNYYDIDAGEYVFIPNEEIGSENVQRAVIPAERNVTIVNQTTNVTSITYNNNTIVNEGPNYDELRGRSRQPLQRMRIQRDYDVERNEAPRASVRGDMLQMITPLFTARATERPRTAGPALRQTTVDRSSVGNAAEVESVRAKMRAEATPPPDAPPKRFQKPVVTAAPAATPTAATATATPVPATTAAPTVAPTSTIAPTVVPVATATPQSRPSVAHTPAPSATARPAFTPRGTPTPAATPLSTPAAPVATPAITARPALTPRGMPSPAATPLSTPAAPVATPAATIARPAMTASPAEPAESKPAPPEGNDPAGGRAEQLRRRQEAAQKMMGNRARQLPSPAGVSIPPTTPIVPAATTPAPRLTPPPRAAAPAPLTSPEAAVSPVASPGTTEAAPSPAASPNPRGRARRLPPGATPEPGKPLQPNEP